MTKSVKVADQWKPQHFREHAPSEISSEVIENSIATANIILKKNKNIPPLLTLGHLAFLLGLEPEKLRRFVNRKNSKAYKTFFLKKNSHQFNGRGYRMVSVPTQELKMVQRWISDRILSYQKPHAASTAYSPGSSISQAVELHLQCKWLIKMDITAFFDSISEISVQRIFREIGYQPLVAFELARLCTRTSNSSWREHSRWKVVFPTRFKKIDDYRNERIGFLPQGSPSSPMLSNLVMRNLDEAMQNIASKYNFRYSRYADDLAFSTSNASNRRECLNIIKEAYGVIIRNGLTPNLTKTKIAPPGSRKLLLGLLVDSSSPRLTKEFRKNIRMHLHFLHKHGPSAHATARSFQSVYGLRNHLFGLAYFARQIEPAYGADLLTELKKISWPI